MHAIVSPWLCGSARQVARATRRRMQTNVWLSMWVLLSTIWVAQFLHSGCEAVFATIAGRIHSIARLSVIVVWYDCGNTVDAYFDVMIRTSM